MVIWIKDLIKEKQKLEGMQNQDWREGLEWVQDIYFLDCIPVTSILIGWLDGENEGFMVEQLVGEYLEKTK